MNLILEIFIFFHYFNVFCRCSCYNIKNEQNNKINKKVNNENNYNNNKEKVKDKEDIDSKYWYVSCYNEKFLIDENLIKQKKFKEIVANNFGKFNYTFFNVDDFINIEN